MRKYALIAALILTAFVSTAHAVNPYAWKGTISTTTRKATETMSGDIKVFDNIDRTTTSFELNGGTPTIKNGAGIGKVLTSNATGVAAWTQMTYNSHPIDLVVSTGVTAASVTVTAASIGIEEYVAVNVSTGADITKTGAGGLDTGAEAASTYYWVWLIYDSSGTNGVGCILSVSSTSPTMPTGYNKKRRVDFVYNNSGSNFFAFRSVDGWHDHQHEMDYSINGAPTTSAYTTLALSSTTVPAVECQVIIGAEVSTGGGGGARTVIRPMGAGYAFTAARGVIGLAPTASSYAASQIIVRQNSSRQVQYYCDANTATLTIAVLSVKIPGL